MYTCSFDLLEMPIDDDDDDVDMWRIISRVFIEKLSSFNIIYDLKIGAYCYLIE